MRVRNRKYIDVRLKKTELPRIKKGRVVHRYVKMKDDLKAGEVIGIAVKLVQNKHQAGMARRIATLKSKIALLEKEMKEE